MDRTGRSNLPGHTFPGTVRSDRLTITRISRRSGRMQSSSRPAIPMLAGLGYLKGEVFPGISSLQIAVARLHIPLSRVAVVVAHGRGHDQGLRDTLDEVKRGKIVFLLTDPKFNVSDLYNHLAALSLPLQIAVLENLAYPTERIITGDIASPPQPVSRPVFPCHREFLKRQSAVSAGRTRKTFFLLRVQE